MICGTKPLIASRTPSMAAASPLPDRGTESRLADAHRHRSFPMMGPSMRSLRNYFLLGLVLMVLGLSALAWKQYQELVALRAATLTSGERADWQKRVWAAQKRAQKLEDELAAPRAGKTAATAGEATQPDRGAPPRPDIGKMMSGFASMMDRPEATRLLALQQKAQVDARYAALFKKLGLPPDRLAQFKSLLADRLSTPIDVLAAAGQQGINPIQDPQAFRQLVQNAQAEIDGKIQALLDPGSYAQYQNYVQTEPQRTIVNQLQQALSYTTAPLSSAQTDQLVQILAETSPARGAATATGAAVTYVGRPGPGGEMTAVAVGPPPPDGGGIAGGSLVTDDAITRAQSVLSAPQVQALQQIQQQQQAASQLRQQMFLNAAAGGAMPPPPPGPPPGG
jgi:hypothetical protein